MTDPTTGPEGTPAPAGVPSGVPSRTLALAYHAASTRLAAVGYRDAFPVGLLVDLVDDLVAATVADLVAQGWTPPGPPEPVARVVPRRRADDPPAADTGDRRRAEDGEDDRTW